jgi:hypothetical protein
MTMEIPDPGKAKEGQISQNLPARSASRSKVHQRIEATLAQPGKNLERIACVHPTPARLIGDYFVKDQALWQEVAGGHVTLGGMMVGKEGHVRV